MSRNNLLLGIGILYPFSILVLWAVGAISGDAMLALILLSFAPALFPAIVENYRKKRGWNLVSTTTTTLGQGVLIPLYVAWQLPITVAIGSLLTIAWAVLTAQAVAYRGNGA